VGEIQSGNLASDQSPPFCLHFLGSWRVQVFPIHSPPIYPQQVYPRHQHDQKCVTTLALIKADLLGSSTIHAES
jgi:hypothetical protein